jgi:hypothetical protein
MSMPGLLGDLRFGAHVLAKSPVFTASEVLLHPTGFMAWDLP